MKRLAVLALALVAGLTAAAAPAAPSHKRPASLEFRGQVIIPTGTTFDGTQVGGLSGIQYAGHGTFYSLSDDPSQFGPARFYKLRADIGDGRLTPGDITFLDVTTLKQPDGTLFPTASLDPEGFALTRNRKVVVTSEGFTTRGIDPWVRLFRLDGSHDASLPVPDQFLLGPGKGVRQNLGFESATVTHGYLWTGSENALAQDGPAATVSNGSPSRLLRYKLKRGTPDRQYVYVDDPIAEPPVPPTNFAVSGLVDMLALDKKSFLTIERSFSVGAPGTGNKIKLYRVDLRGADDISRFSSIAGVFGIDAAKKTLLLNLDVLGLPLDNVEGMAFGPRLRDGRRTLLLVSDNNFAAAQFTQFLLFAYGSSGKDH